MSTRLANASSNCPSEASGARSAEGPFSAANGTIRALVFTQERGIPAPHEGDANVKGNTIPSKLFAREIHRRRMVVR
jgi:hypothetical protein